jgi:predicted nucleic acid-binding protein
VTVFVDTSAIFALLNDGDRFHGPASETLEALAEQQETLLTSNYVLLETFALVGNRLGLSAVRALQSQLVPLFDVYWVDEVIHERAVSALLATGARQLSLVDCVSFELMRELNLDSAFAMDAHFRERGFTCLP